MYNLPLIYVDNYEVLLPTYYKYRYYGLGLWLPELFNRMSSHLELDPEAQVTMCTAGIDLPTNATADNIPCHPTDVDTSVFQSSLIMGGVGLLGNVIAGLLANRLQRRTLPGLEPYHLVELSGLITASRRYKLF